MVLNNDMEFDNKFISQLKDNMALTVDGQALWDTGTGEAFDNAIVMAEKLRDQNQFDVGSKEGYGRMLDELNLAKGIRAGIGEQTAYTKYGGDEAGTDLSTFERVQGLKKQRAAAQDQLAVDKGTSNYMSEILQATTKGVNQDTYFEGEGDKDSETYIESYEEWSGTKIKKDGNGRNIMPARDKDFEDYVHTTRLTQMSVKHGGTFLNALADMSNGTYENVKGIQEDERALNAQRDKDKSSIMGLSAEEAGTY
jgi:hypothetical protein